MEKTSSNSEGFSEQSERQPLLKNITQFSRKAYEKIQRFKYDNSNNFGTKQFYLNTKKNFKKIKNKK